MVQMTIFLTPEVAQTNPAERPADADGADAMTWCRCR